MLLLLLVLAVVVAAVMSWRWSKRPPSDLARGADLPSLEKRKERSTSTSTVNIIRDRP